MTKVHILQIIHVTKYAQNVSCGTLVSKIFPGGACPPRTASRFQRLPHELLRLHINYPPGTLLVSFTIVSRLSGDPSSRDLSNCLCPISDDDTSDLISGYDQMRERVGTGRDGPGEYICDDNAMAGECRDEHTNCKSFKPWSHLTVMNVVERNSFARS